MLRKQLVPVQFGDLDEKTESKQLSPGGMTRVVNAERNKSGRYDKRTGYASVSSTYLDSGGSSTASNLKALGTTGNSIFALDGDDSGDYRLLGYSDGAAKFADKGGFTPCGVKTVRMGASNSSSVPMAACASTSDYTCIAWIEDTDSPSVTTLMMRVLDNSTKNIVASKNQTVAFSVGCVQVVEKDDVFHIFTQSSTNDIDEYTWDASSPTSDGTDFTSVGTIVTDLLSGNGDNFIVRNSGTYLILFYADTGSVMQLSRSTGNGTWTSLANSQAGNRPVGLVFDGTENIYTWARDSGGALDYAIYAIDGTLIKANAAALGTGEGAVGGVSTGASSILYWQNDDGSSDARLLVGVATTSGLGASITPVYWLHAVTDGWTRNGKHYFMGVYVSDTQPTYFVFQVSASTMRVVAKILPREGVRGGSYGYPVPANVGLQSGDVVNIPVLIATGFETPFFGGGVVAQYGVGLSSLNYKTVYEIPHVSLGDSALIGGGLLHLYDGRIVTENGWNVYPEIVSLTQSNGSGSIANGTYSYKCVFEWVDAKGALHRSEPSPAVSITTTGANDTVTVDFKNISSLSNKPTREGVLVVYRTTDGGTTYYRLPRTGTAQSGSNITDIYTDAQIESNEVLYTNGGELANQQPPACGHLAVYKNRVWATDLEDGSQAWYSKLRVTNNDPYSFNESLVLSVGDSERALASQALDDKLVLFKERQLLYTYGEGPDNTGQNGAFAEPVDVNFDGGIAEPASLVKFPQGLIFKHQRGFYAIGADLNPVYIGKNVEDFNDETVTSAVLIPSKNQIRWTHSAGSILAYDYFHQQWYEYSDVQCSGGTVRDGKHVIVSSNTIYEQDDTVWTDGGSSYNFLVQTGWISFAGLSGFKRVYKIFFEAVYKADHDLTVTVDMEQDGTVYTDTYTVDAATVSGGTDTYRWEIALSRQKCSSIRVKIEDTSLAGTEQSLNIINMSMLVGLKAGGAKYASAKQIG